MTLSKKERIAIFIIIVVVIGVAGFFFFILPQYRDIEPNQALLETKRAELASLQAELNDENERDLDRKILDAYNSGDKLSEVFHEEMTEIEADRYIRELLSKVNDYYGDNPGAFKLNLDSFTITGIGTTSLATLMYTPQGVMYDIKDKTFVDTSVFCDGREQNDAPAPSSVDEMVATMRGMSVEGWFEYYTAETANNISPELRHAMREALAGFGETVAVQSVSFSLWLTPEEFDALSVYIFEQEMAMKIKTMAFAEMAPDGAPEEETMTVDHPDPEMDAVSFVVPAKYNPQKMYEITIDFYCVERMAEPPCLN
ncbi:MAG: hypothetical protein FWD34_08700 [Oscillospiraceae bacterium]|nr:hypothetical protein [Oscillospiraceae bacterium]